MPIPAGMATGMSGWADPEPEPPKEQVDWDLYLGPAAWRPFNHAQLRRLQFRERAAAWSAAESSNGVRIAWTSASGPTTPTARRPSSTIRPRTAKWLARYANGVKLVLRNDGWLPLGSCPVRFEGDTGWVETGDSGKLVLSSPALLAGRKVAEIGGYPANFHIRDFLDCVKIARQAAGQRRGGLPFAHRLPCRPTSPCSWAARWPTIRGRTSSSATRKPTGSAARRFASRGDCRSSGFEA